MGGSSCFSTLMLPKLAAKVCLHGAGLRFHSGLDAQRKLQTRGCVGRTCCMTPGVLKCSSYQGSSCFSTLMLPKLAAKVCLHGAGLRFHSGLDAQRKLQTRGCVGRKCCITPSALKCISYQGSSCLSTVELPKLAATVCLHGAGLQFHSVLDARTRRSEDKTRRKLTT